jgi:hypothetical protein
VPGNGEAASDRLMGGRRPPHLRIDIGWRGENTARPSQIGAASPARRRDGRISGPLYAARRLPGRDRIEGRACQCAGRRQAKVRVLTGNVGGSFGMNSQVYPEYFDLFHAGKALGRPVKWTDERGESFVSDSHGRDHEMTAELALDAEGNFLAVSPPAAVSDRYAVPLM